MKKDFSFSKLTIIWGFVQTILRDAISKRTRNFDEFAPANAKLAGLEFLPWTASPGPKGVRSALLNQIKVTHDKAMDLAEDRGTR